MAVDLNKVKETLFKSFPDAKIELVDEVGDGNHLFLHIVSNSFNNLSSLDRHKLIYSTLKEYMHYIHALSIKAETPTGAN